MIDDFFSDPWFSERRLASHAFCIDVQEKDKEYLIEAELPGVAKDQVSIDLNEGNLSIAVQREDNINEENKKLYSQRTALCLDAPEHLSWRRGCRRHSCKAE